MSRKVFLLNAGLAFLVCLVSMYFGASIYNANENILVGHLNDMDRLNYYDAADVPALSRLAVIVNLVFLFLLFIAEIFVLLKSPVKQVKRIALGILTAITVLFILSILTLKNPYFFDFSQWGFAWIFTGLFAVAGNGLSVFLKPKA